MEERVLKRSCAPGIIIDAFNTKNAPHKANINSNDKCNLKQSSRIPKLNNDAKPSKIPVSPSFQRKLNASRATNSNSPQQHKSKLELTSQNKVFDKPINRTQSSYVIQSKSSPKQSSYGQNKERS